MTIGVSSQSERGFTVYSRQFTALKIKVFLIFIVKNLLLTLFYKSNLLILSETGEGWNS